MRTALIVVAALATAVVVDLVSGMVVRRVARGRYKWLLEPLRQTCRRPAAAVLLVGVLYYALPPGSAEPITRATLGTLAGRVTGGQARDLPSQLTEELRGLVRRPTEDPERFGLAEFFERVQSRAGVDRQVASAGARAVLDALRESASAKEYGDLVDQSPQEFWQLTGPGTGRLETHRVGT